MALVLADRVQEYSTTTGTGTITLSGAYAGFQTFAAGIGNGNTCYYTITSDKNQWEVGIGTVGIGTLARTTLISSSTGSTIDFQGTLTVFVTLPAEEAVYGDGTTLVAPSGALLPIASGGTGASTAAAARTALGLGTIATQAANSVAITGGAISNTSITVKDDVFTLQDNVDPTKQAQFQLSGINTGTTYTYTLPNSSGILAGTNIAQNWTSAQTFAAGSNTLGSSAGVTTTGVGSGATTTGLTKTVNIGTGGLSGSTTAITVGSANGSTTTMLGSTVIGGLSGNQSLQVNNITNAVNYTQITGAATGAAPTISAQGSDANIGLVLTGKGTGVVALGGTTAANSGVQVKTTTSSVNYLVLNGGATGSNPAIQTDGTDANVGLTINTKGTGAVLYTINYAPQFKINPAASAVNFVQAMGAVTTGAPELSAQGSDANINLKLTPKGTGVLQFGTYTAGVLSPTGYITITDAAGTSRRLLVG